MIESQVDRYSLDCKSKVLSLKVCLLNNQLILMELTNKQGPEKYKAILSLAQLKGLCAVFHPFEKIDECLILIKNTIELGKISIEEKVNESKTELEFNINRNSVDFPPFVINLLSEENPGNKEFENKFGNIAYNTTELSSIVESNVKPNVMELEYIQPIVQFHYPDGSTRNRPLTPTLQSANGNALNMSEEQIKTIKEMINRDNVEKNGLATTKENINTFRTSNIGPNYSTRTMPQSIKEIGQNNSPGTMPQIIGNNRADYSTRTMPVFTNNNIGNVSFSETENIKSKEDNQVQFQINNINENPEQTPTYYPNNEIIPIIPVEPNLTLLPNNGTVPVNDIQPTMSIPVMYMEPNIYQSNIYNSLNIPVYSNTFQNQMPMQTIYPLATQFNYNLGNQVLPQPLINNMGSQYYVNPLSRGLNTFMPNSLMYPRKIYYSRLKFTNK